MSSAELEDFFLLDALRLDVIANKAGDHNRSGMRCRLVRRGTWHLPTDDPLEVEWPAVDYVASQMDIASVSKR